MFYSLVPNHRMISVIVSLLEIFFKCCLRRLYFFTFYFLFNKMLDSVLKDVESKHDRINKWLFIYKQWEFLIITGRKLKSEMINSGFSTVFGHVFCIALGF